ncbi:hypothetical protein GE09DRAFT_1176904 [Coniochaeta sp. 2T2.1]|nr:hypothetical protein GE09DRAFT_1176904 [Coniochaeta sp. 2T2.1]
MSLPTHRRVGHNHHTAGRILFFSPVRHALATLEALGRIANVELVANKSRSEFFDDIKEKYHDIVVIYRTSSSGAVAGKFDAKYVEACTARGTVVTHSPDPVTNATADLTIFLVLGRIRQLNPAIYSLRKGNFKNGLDFGQDPQGKVLGILGMGRIGRAVVQRVIPVGMRPIYHNRTKLPDDQAEGAIYVSFDQLLSQSDAISIHVPLSKETPRGAIIDERAMINALDKGHIASVGLDVYETEPEVDEGLVRNERALLIPHLGTHTTETLAQMEEAAMANATRTVLGEELLNVVPELRFGMGYNL